MISGNASTAFFFSLPLPFLDLTFDLAGAERLRHTCHTPDKHSYKDAEVEKWYPWRVASIPIQTIFRAIKLTLVTFVYSFVSCISILLLILVAECLYKAPKTYIPIDDISLTIPLMFFMSQLNPCIATLKFIYTSDSFDNGVFPILRLFCIIGQRSITQAYSTILFLLISPGCFHDTAFLDFYICTGMFLGCCSFRGTKDEQT